MPFVPGVIPPRVDSRQQPKKSAAASFEIHRGWWESPTGAVNAPLPLPRPTALDAKVQKHPARSSSYQASSLALETMTGGLTKPKRKFTRCKTGCLTCRARRKKCDETKPICNNCERLGLVCKAAWSSTAAETQPAPLPTNLQRPLPSIPHIASFDETVRIYLPVDLKIDSNVKKSRRYGSPYFPLGPVKGQLQKEQDRNSLRIQLATPVADNRLTALEWPYNASEIQQTPPLLQAGHTSSSSSSLSGSSWGKTRRTNGVSEDDNASYYSQSTMYSISDTAASEKVAEIMTIKPAGKATVIQISELLTTNAA